MVVMDQAVWVELRVAMVSEGQRRAVKLITVVRVTTTTLIQIVRWGWIIESLIIRSKFNRNRRFLV